MPLIRAWIAEAVGTFLLVLFGTGVVAAAVMTGAQMGLWQVAAVWAVGVAVAIYAASHISGAHLNPAVSLAFAIFRPREFPRAAPAPLLVGAAGGRRPRRPRRPPRLRLLHLALRGVEGHR